MRTEVKSRLGRVSAAIAVGLVALAGVASTASAQNWNGYNGGYYPYSNAPFNSPYSNRGWTWGERYGAPPNAYYSGQGYYGQQGYYAPQNSYPQAYGSNPNAALGQLQGLFVR